MKAKRYILRVRSAGGNEYKCFKVRNYIIFEGEKNYTGGRNGERTTHEAIGGFGGVP
ncbi:MAG: hypothetical protein QMD22_10980 [archaeon]|nr:hypothetical protein [archaeon]